jgi:hypothetical protein
MMAGKSGRREGEDEAQEEEGKNPRVVFISNRD